MSIWGAPYAACICEIKILKKIFKIFCIFVNCCTFLMGTSFEPPNKEGEKNVLSKEEIWMKKFDACVKKALIQELKYRKRSMKTQKSML